MSFGKRGTGEGHPARNLLPPPLPIDAAEATVGRMKVANPGGIDKGFIALATGVVLVSAGAALAAPSVMEMFSAIPVRPIEVVVAGLDREQAKIALAREAFPDAEGRAFMTSLQSKFPKDHDALLGAIAERALDGGDRDDLYMEVNEWSATFAPKQFAAISRTGNDGFDESLEIVEDALTLIEKTAGKCTPDALMTIAYNPETLASLTSYGSEGYKMGMRASRTFVDLAHTGAGRSPVDTDLTPDDMTALQTTLFSLAMDPQVMSMMSSSAGGMQMGSGPNGAACR